VFPGGCVGLAIGQRGEVARRGVGEAVGEHAHLHFVGLAPGRVVGVQGHVADLVDVAGGTADATGVGPGLRCAVGGSHPHRQAAQRVISVGDRDAVGVRVAQDAVFEVVGGLGHDPAGILDQPEPAQVVIVVGGGANRLADDRQPAQRVVEVGDGRAVGRCRLGQARREVVLVLCGLGHRSTVSASDTLRAAAAAVGVAGLAQEGIEDAGDLAQAVVLVTSPVAEAVTAARALQQHHPGPVGVNLLDIRAVGVVDARQAAQGVMREGPGETARVLMGKHVTVEPCVAVGMQRVGADQHHLVLEPGAVVDVG